MQTTQTQTQPILAHLYDLCYQAHRNVSFVPEKRANYYVNHYSNILQEDLLELGDKQGNYKDKFIAKFSAWMHAKSNCISSMITGPARFPVRKAQKANASEMNRMNELIEWRNRYFKAVNRVPTKSPEDELIDAERKLERAIMYQDELKELNKDIRSSKLNKLPEDMPELIKFLLAKGWSADRIRIIQYRAGKLKIPAFHLTNNNARIKLLKQKILAMESRIERKNNWQDINFDGGYVTIEDDRVKIYHDVKPEREIIQEIKSNGFRWSPNWGCWCRKHTGNAIYVTKQLSFIKNHI